MISGLTIDLDDTLWPFAPIGEAIGAATAEWLAEHAPGTARWYTRERFVEFAMAVRAERADLGHDLGAAHRETLRRMLAEHGDDPDGAAALYDVAHTARQTMELHPDAEPALERLAARFPIVSVTNGNAEIERLRLDRWMVGHLRADVFGVAKPEARIFAEACRMLDLPAAQVMHVGDDLHHDVQGALAAGLQAAWVHRGTDGDAPPGALVVRDLGELADRLLAEPDALT